MKIYTRTGDGGQTSLVGGKRVSKASTRLEAYGTVDELNSHIGLLRSFDIPDEGSRQTLEDIQSRLFDLGAYLATDFADAESAATVKGIGSDQIAILEEEIDRLDLQLPRLNCFILPGGCPAGAQANVARAVARRAERRIIALSAQATLADDAIKYVNRLSDYLFTLSRALNRWASVAETPWHQS